MTNGNSICAYLLVITESDNLLKGKNLLKRVPKAQELSHRDSNWRLARRVVIESNPLEN